VLVGKNLKAHPAEETSLGDSFLGACRSFFEVSLTILYRSLPFTFGGGSIHCPPSAKYSSLSLSICFVMASWAIFAIERRSDIPSSIQEGDGERRQANPSWVSSVCGRIRAQHGAGFAVSIRPGLARSDPPGAFEMKGQHSPAWRASVGFLSGAWFFSS
jgi:hypothetical protein